MKKSSAKYLEIKLREVNMDGLIGLFSFNAGFARGFIALWFSEKRKIIPIKKEYHNDIPFSFKHNAGARVAPQHCSILLHYILIISTLIFRVNFS